MGTAFINLLNLSITASYIVLAIILLRLIFKKAPKWLSCLLWGLVAIRLVFPFSVESFLSLIPSAAKVPETIIYNTEPTFVINTIPVVNYDIVQSTAQHVQDSVTPVLISFDALGKIWLCGACAMLLYAAISYFVIAKKTRASIETEKGIYICEDVPTPFILGIIKPKIILPSVMDENNVSYVVAHEKAHLKRLDHFWKPLGFALLSVYWFNPVMWVAYILFCRDIELACDERVIKDMGEEDKKAYSTALLSCSAPRKMITACPLAFGEVGVKERIKGVLNYKKPAFWIIAAAIVASAVIAVCFLTDPEKSEQNNNSTEYNDIELNPASTSVSFIDNDFENEFAVSKAFVFAGVSANYELFYEAQDGDKQGLYGYEFLPIHKLESVSDISAFKEKFSDFQFSHNLDLPQFDDIAVEYNDEFFKDNILLITHVVTQGVGNCLINTGNVSKENVVFYIEKEEEKSSDALYGWLLCIGVNRRFIDSDTQFDAIVINEGSVLGTWVAPASVVGLNVSEIPEKASVYYAFYANGTGVEWNDINADVSHVFADMYRREFTYTVENGILTITYLNDSKIAYDDFKQFRYNVSGARLTLSDINTNRILELTRFIGEPVYNHEVEVYEEDSEIRFSGEDDMPKILWQ